MRCTADQDRQRLGRRSMPGTDKDLQKFGYNDKPLMDKYPGWDFYMIDPFTADVCYAVFTNQLEKEFALEIAHLWNDGTLHRIYHLIY